jgi:hypothetical protein
MLANIRIAAQCVQYGHTDRATRRAIAYAAVIACACRFTDCDSIWLSPAAYRDIIFNAGGYAGRVHRF